MSLQNTQRPGVLNNALLPSVLGLAGLFGCAGSSTVEHEPPRVDETRFEVLDPNTTGIRFENRIDETEQLNLFVYEYLYNGAGVAVGDINNDGLPDLYFVSNLGADALYLNQGGFRFVDISAQAGIDRAKGYKTGVVMVDVNGDGLLDIHICRSGLADPNARRNLLYINNGDLTFTERAAEYGIDDASYSTQAYFLDIDRDGDLDLFLLNHPADMREANNLRVTSDAQGNAVVAMSADLTHFSDRLYRNDGGRFTDITQRAGLLNEAFGLSAIIGDFNNDLLPDIYVANDYSRPDFLYIANTDGTYTERFEEYFQHCALSSMGSDRADINNDGCLDVITLDMVPGDRYRYQMLSMEQNYDRFQRSLEVGLGAQFSANTLQLSRCNGQHSDIAFMAGVAYTDWSWSALIADLDNDGWKDILVTNGLKRDLTNNDFKRYVKDSVYKAMQQGRATVMDLLNAIPSVAVRSYLFRNNGDLTFADVTQTWNSGPPGFNNGAAYADLDGDGLLDLVTNNLNGPATVLRNRGQDGHAYLRFAPDMGRGRPAYGTRITVRTELGEQVQELHPARGFLSASEPVLHFGLGSARTVASVTVRWPDGSVQDLGPLATNTLHVITPSRDLGSVPTPSARTPLVRDASHLLPRSFSHTENPFIDFKREPLLHHKLSEEGPGVAVGDVNGDGLDDVYLGGAFGHAGKLFVQDRSGRFMEQAQKAFTVDQGHEDVTAVFLDVDSDGDLDLFVGSGGNERAAGDPAYQDRLYMNDGKGNFTRASDALPQHTGSTGCVAVGDINGDGRPDLFVGGRLVPGRYPEAPESRLLRNDGGRFSDVTAQWSSGLANIGMVTDARFADLEGDGILELAIVGEWMPIMVFQQVSGVFRDHSEQWGLAGTEGWWCSLDAADLNGDGRPELVAGNLGLNSVFKASRTDPVTLHYKDFDGNGTLDPVLCRSYGGVTYPVHTRDRMLDQMVFLRKRFQRYHPYAMARLQDVFTTAELSGAGVLKANTFAHTLLINRDGERFEARPLPTIAQLSMARAMRFTDMDGDGHTDLVVAGNFHGTDAQFGRHDACVGLLMRGDGRGELVPLPVTESGLVIQGNVRAVVPYNGPRDQRWLVVRNHGQATVRLRSGIVP